MKKGLNLLFLISVILTFVIAILSTISTIEYGNMTIFEFIKSKYYTQPEMPDSFSAITYALAGAWFSVLIPLFVSLPKLFDFADCMQSGFWRFLLSRTSRRRFKLDNWLSIVINGALAVVIGYLLYLIIIILLFPKNNNPDEFLSNPLCALLGTKSIWIAASFKMIFLFIFSAMTISIVLCLYLMNESIYKSIGMPIVVYYILSTFAESCFRKNGNLKFYIISPQHLISTSDFWFEQTFKLSFWILPLIILLITALMFFLYSKLMDWRIK